MNDEDEDQLLKLALSLFPSSQPPYSVQVDFIRSMLATLNGRGQEDHHHHQYNAALMESPTGTGKTKSLLCGALAWQLSSFGRKDVNGKCINENANYGNSLSNEPEWIRKARASMANDHPVSAERRMQPSKRRRFDGIDEKIARLIDTTTADDDGDTSMATTKPPHGPRIFYCSRTHSQLGQVMEEVGRLLEQARTTLADIADLSSYRAVSLGSRKGLCIHPRVSKMTNAQRMTDACLSMTADTCDDDDDEEEEVKGSNRCKFNRNAIEGGYDRMMMEAFRNHPQVADIEDLVRIGRDTGACPYYGSREIFQRGGANFITLPYNLILSREARRALEIDLGGSLVIFDEAHNLVDIIGQMNSVSVAVGLLEAYAGDLKEYLEKARLGEGGRHERYLHQLVLILDRIIGSLRDSPRPGVIRLNEFIHSCRIDHINVLPIEAYVRSSNLSPRLPASKETGNLFGLGRVMEFLVKILTEPAEDGRILVLHEANSNNNNTPAVILRYISLSPARAMMEVVGEARTVILAGGTMSPMEEMISELFTTTTIDGGEGLLKGVRTFSCGHLVGPDRCLVVPLGVGPSGRTLRLTRQTRSDPGLIREVGQAIGNFCTIVPGGIVVFLPSHAYLRECLGDGWKDIMIGRRRRVFAEDGSSSSTTNNVFEEYRKTILSDGASAILFAVVGGRLSEGINFSDNLGRMVIVVGMPYPDPTDPETQARANNGRSPNDTQRYMQSRCMRAVNQSIGRVIRHAKDYGVVVLIDERYQGSQVQSRLPRWIQECIASNDDHKRDSSNYHKRDASNDHNGDSLNDHKGNSLNDHKGDSLNDHKVVTNDRKVASNDHNGDSSHSPLSFGQAHSKIRQFFRQFSL